MDSNDPADIKKANALQDAVTVAQSDPGTFKVPDWDLEQLKTLRDAINVLAATKEDQSGFFGDKSKLNPIDHLLGTAFGWGGNPKEGAIYLSRKTEKNDGQAPYTMTITDTVPLDKGGFFSITIYNEAGFMEKNDAGIYSLNDVTAKRNMDGSLTINAGGCGDGRVNCLPITKGWSYHVRLYRPGAKILSGEYQFPRFEVVN